MSNRSITRGSIRGLRGSWRAKTFVLATGVSVSAFALSACTNASGTSAGYGAAPPAPVSVAPAPAGAELTTATTALGTILVDGHGRAVYRFAGDMKGQSNCTGACLQYWPAVTSSDKPTAAGSVTAGLGVITRSDGTKQLTVNGWPVYTFAGDNSPGVTSGQGSNEFGGLWWVASTSGAEIMSTAGSANSTPSASKSSTGRRY